MNNLQLILTLLGIIVIHNIADFWCQTTWQAKNKWNDIKALSLHVLLYTFIVWLPMQIYCMIFHWHNIQGFLLFMGITFISHWITDYFTSKLSHRYYEEGKFYGIPSFWFIISVDQILHYLQLFLTFYFLFL